MLLGDTVMTSVHVLFDESIPARSADYFKELEEATVKVDPEERRVCDFDWLVGKPHMDEELLYNTTKVVVWRGLIVGFRALVTAGKQQIEDKTPIHIADLQSMTEDFARRLRKERPGSHDDDAGGVASTVAREVTRPAEPEASSGREIGPSDVSERIAEKAENAVNAGRRVRKQRVLTEERYAWWIVGIFLHCYKRLIVSSCLTVCSIGNLRAIRLDYCLHWPLYSTCIYIS